MLIGGFFRPIPGGFDHEFRFASYCFGVCIELRDCFLLKNEMVSCFRVLSE